MPFSLHHLQRAQRGYEQNKLTLGDLDDRWRGTEAGDFDLLRGLAAARFGERLDSLLDMDLRRVCRTGLRFLLRLRSRRMGVLKIPHYGGANVVWAYRERCLRSVPPERRLDPLRLRLRDRL